MCYFLVMTIADQLVEALEEAKPRHDAREMGGGRYKKSRLCDACGRPVGTDNMSDGDVCGGTDGPGFYLCDKKRCIAKRDAMSVEQRRQFYTAQRAKNDSTGM